MIRIPWNCSWNSWKTSTSLSSHRKTSRRAIAEHSGSVQNGVLEMSVRTRFPWIRSTSFGPSTGMSRGCDISLGWLVKNPFWPLRWKCVEHKVGKYLFPNPNLSLLKINTWLVMFLNRNKNVLTMLFYSSDLLDLQNYIFVACILEYFFKNVTISVKYIVPWLDVYVVC